MQFQGSFRTLKFSQVKTKTWYSSITRKFLPRTTGSVALVPSVVRSAHFLPSRQTAFYHIVHKFVTCTHVHAQVYVEELTAQWTCCEIFMNDLVISDHHSDAQSVEHVLQSHFPQAGKHRPGYRYHGIEKFNDQESISLESWRS